MAEDHDLTRRQWLLRLGHGVVLTGVSGAVGELATDALAAAQTGSAASGALPPGLYLPNNDHLTHALTSDDRFHPIPAGTETEYARPRTGPFQPQFFSQEEFATVRRLVELFLGDGDASKAEPGAEGSDIVTEVSEWIDLIIAGAPAVREAARRLTPEQRALAVRYDGAAAVEELETSDPQTVWREGLGWLREESQRRFGKEFLDVSQDEQIQLLTAIGGGLLEGTPANLGQQLFVALKAETIRGYYTSRRGLDELDYQGNTYHVECPGCTTHGDS